MKFSHKLFKIQAKMSLPVFILMGSVCHLGAMEGELSSRDEFSNGDEIRSRSTWRVRYDEKHADDSSDKNDESVQDELASSPNAVPVRSVVKKSLARVLAEFRRNEEVDSSNAKNLQFRQRLLDRTARNAAGRGQQRQVSQSSFGHREVLNDPESGLPVVHFGFEDQYAPHLKKGFSSPGDMSDLVNPQEGVSSRKKTSLYKSPKSPLEEAIKDVLDAAIERNSPKKSPVETVGDMLRQRAGYDSVDPDTMVVHGRKHLDFSGEIIDEAALVVSNPLQEPSILTRKADEELTLQIKKGDETFTVTTTKSQLLAAPDFTAASHNLTINKIYFGVLKAEQDKDKDALDSLLADLIDCEGYNDFQGSDQELLERLKRDAIARSPELLGNFIDFAGQIRCGKAAIGQLVEGGTKLVSYTTDLEQRYTRLQKQAFSMGEKMKSSFEAFNNAFSIFGYSVQAGSVVDGSVVTRVQETYGNLREDQKQLQKHYAELSSASAGYIQKMDADRELIDQLRTEKRNLEDQLRDAKSREDAWKLREAELLKTIESLRSAGSVTIEPQRSSVKAAALALNQRSSSNVATELQKSSGGLPTQALNQKSAVKSSVPSHVVGRKHT